jgi:hypothetical protein
MVAPMTYDPKLVEVVGRLLHKMEYENVEEAFDWTPSYEDYKEEWDKDAIKILNAIAAYEQEKVKPEDKLIKKFLDDQKEKSTPESEAHKAVRRIMDGL